MSRREKALAYIGFSVVIFIITTISSCSSAKKNKEVCSIVDGAVICNDEPLNEK